MVAGGEGCLGAGTHPGGWRELRPGLPGDRGHLWGWVLLAAPPHAEVERWEAEGPWAEGSLVPRVVPPVHSPTLDTDAGTCLASAATGAVQ